MALTNDQITAQNFKDFYGQIRPYLNGAAHAGFTPVGTVISIMGKQAPLNYLVCDGMVYNIKDYPELAAYFAGQFEISNFFGGDGETTFAVPDLRGEFLRGTGTNSHTNQGNGGVVGEHQDGTTMPQITVSSGKQIAATFASGASMVTNIDAKQNKYNKYVISSSGGTVGTDSDWDIFTSRPTNTSVLYCIATKNIFVDEGSNYSTDERIVGTWIDGKPIYEKTWDFGSDIFVSNTSWYETSIVIGDYAMSKIIDVKNINNDGSNYTLMATLAISSKVQVLASRANDVVSMRYLTLRYTKATD